jgi:putative membrane protein
MSTQDLPTLNALLNSTAAVLLFLGYRAIRAGDRARHQKLMFSAFVVSAVFLASYLTYHALHGSRSFPEALPALRPSYLGLLISHVILAIVNLPLILMTLWRAYKGRFAEHKRIAQLTWGIWMYVSVSGVLVYVMLYVVAPWLLSI